MNDLKTDLPSKVVFLKTGADHRRSTLRRQPLHPPSVGGLVRSNRGLTFHNLHDGRYYWYYLRPSARCRNQCMVSALQSVHGENIVVEVTTKVCEMLDTILELYDQNYCVVIFSSVVRTPD